MKKIAFVVQRYGSEVNGGAEYHCRILAERLKGIYDIEILTSCAKDYITWANVYPEGLSTINGIKVRRFRSLEERNNSEMRHLGKILRKRRWYQKLLKFFGLLTNFEKFFQNNPNMDELNYNWSKHQGPFVPGLVDFIRDKEIEYDIFIFFTYLYFPTLYGLREVPHKSILIPTAHDEPFIYLPVFHSLFKSPGAILYNTVAEKKLVESIFENSQIYNDVIGVGIDEDCSCDFSVGIQNPVAGNYVLYIGRIDPSKGCGMLIDYFLRYKKASNSDMKLVLVGRASMNIPSHPDIIYLGFVQEEVKKIILVGAKALINPSLVESLSLVTLESMAAGVPVIANRHCEVLKDHILESKAGFLFSDYKSFKSVLETLISGSVNLEALKVNGQDYVKRYYSWNTVVTKLKKAVDHVILKQ